MEHYIFTGGAMLLGVSVVYLISLYDATLLHPWERHRSELDGIPPIDEYIRDRIGDDRPGLLDRISARKLRVTIPIDEKPSKISKPQPIGR